MNFFEFLHITPKEIFMKEEFDEQLFETEIKAILMPVHGLTSDIVHTYESKIDDYKSTVYKIGFPLNLITRTGKNIAKLQFKNTSIYPNKENDIWHRLKRLMFLSRKM